MEVLKNYELNKEEFHFTMKLIPQEKINNVLGRKYNESEINSVDF